MFYVYAYLDPFTNCNILKDEYLFTNLPFYIGKGSGNRKNHHLMENELINGTNKHKINKIKKILKKGKSPIVSIVKEFNEEQDALLYESELICFFGRSDNSDDGILVNMTDGGDGVSGYRHTMETKQLISDMQKGIKRSPLSEETKNKIREGNKGKHVSDETRLKISEGNKKRFSDIEERRKISKSLIGKTQSKETREKRSRSLKEFYAKNEVSEETKKLISQSQRGAGNSMAGDKWYRSEEGKKSFKEKLSGIGNVNSKRWRLISPNGEIFERIGGLHSFCKEIIGTSGYNLRKAMWEGREVTKGKAKGWRLLELNITETSL